MVFADPSYREISLFPWAVWKENDKYIELCWWYREICRKFPRRIIDGYRVLSLGCGLCLGLIWWPACACEFWCFWCLFECQWYCFILDNETFQTISLTLSFSLMCVCMHAHTQTQVHTMCVLSVIIIQKFKFVGVWTSLKGILTED